MNPIESKLLEQFLSLAGERLKGEWVLIGGTVLPALGVDHRATSDIDLIGLDSPGQDQTLVLFEIAEKLGLPVETINQAGALFLFRIPDYKKSLVELHRGPNATIYRPDAELYIRLKAQRLAESDLQDCLKFIEFTKKSGSALPSKKIHMFLSSLLNENQIAEKKSRLKQLIETLNAL